VDGHAAAPDGSPAKRAELPPPVVTPALAARLRAALDGPGPDADTPTTEALATAIERIAALAHASGHQQLADWSARAAALLWRDRDQGTRELLPSTGASSRWQMPTSMLCAPGRPPAAEQRMRPTDTPAPNAAEQAIATLLLVDDEPENLRVGIGMLRGQGFEVLVALDGTDGLRIAAATHPYLILLDIRMPGLDGIAVCERMQGDAATRHIPVLFLTALGDIDDKARSFGAGGQFDADHHAAVV
jgi:CheY-like chemotaxis protein